MYNPAADEQPLPMPTGTNRIIRGRGILVPKSTFPRSVISTLVATWRRSLPAKEIQITTSFLVHCTMQGP
ncbi:hypothetical protein PAXRUDRAFT_821083 [Paxillus rubicundulus Ve08.2h10]|uniref:Uncharacterized protein n=1 Tax=Paxillus rubicundulus Ve08.2h10 TaxID=930991 RepID=A0A0D0EB97_9AGAM|nr:hypothetical protein PAXRUDRAFT_821083 [Paxillus rubicundulus Ve08.2h10]